MLQGINEELALPLLPRRPKVKKGPFYESVTGRRVLITGAGGSIGTELSLQVAAAEPAHLTLLDHSEINLYEIDSTIRYGGVACPFSSSVASVRDPAALARLFERERPDVVFHAAALKHVPLLETPGNLVEAVLTNVVGTMRVLDLCANHGSELIFVSTDKAVHPTSTMGLTKRIAEIYLQVQGTARKTRAGVVRFGNVIGSSGSVIPLFRRQIAHGGPVTVTHPDMTRYMMSIQEAVSLVLQSADLNHEHSADMGFYVLDMGEPVRILDLARQLVRFSGANVPIEITGVRPGEKLHEELSYPWEILQPTSKDRVRKAGRLPPLPGVLMADFQRFHDLAARPDIGQAILDDIYGRTTDFLLQSVA